MSSTYQLLFDGKPADEDLYTSVASLEVEENMDLPGALQLNLPINRSEDCDLTRVNEPRLRPLASVAVVVNANCGGGGLAGAAAGAVAGALGGATGGGGGGSGPQCIFDGYVLS